MARDHDLMMTNSPLGAWIFKTKDTCQDALKEILSERLTRIRKASKVKTRLNVMVVFFRYCFINKNEEHLNFLTSLLLRIAVIAFNFAKFFQQFRVKQR